MVLGSLSCFVANLVNGLAVWLAGWACNHLALSLFPGLSVLGSVGLVLSFVNGAWLLCLAFIGPRLLVAGG